MAIRRSPLALAISAALAGASVLPLSAPVQAASGGAWPYLVTINGVQLETLVRVQKADKAGDPERFSISADEARRFGVTDAVGDVPLNVLREDAGKLEMVAEFPDGISVPASTASVSSPSPTPESAPAETAPAPAPTADAWPYVVTIGGKKQEVPVVRRGNAFAISAADARRFGGRADLQGEVVLENVQENPFELTLMADLPLSALDPTRVAGPGRAATGDILEQRLGAWLNYTLDGRHTDRSGTSYSVLTDLNISLPRGVVRHLQIEGSGSVASKRLMTSYQLDLPERRSTFVLGDAYSSSSAHAAGAKFAGIQLRRNYGLDPNYIYWPSLTLTGTARAPSTFEVFEGNRRVSGGTLERGDFAIEDYTSFVGQSGQVRLIVRDAQGNEQVITQQLYTAPGALKPGELAYGLDFGVGYQASDDLGDDPYGSAAIRYGFSRLTLEGGADYFDGDASGFAGLVIPSRIGSWAYRRIQGELAGESRSIDRASWEKTFLLGVVRELRLYASGDRTSRDDDRPLNLQLGASYTDGAWSVFGTSLRIDDAYTHSLGANVNLGRYSVGGSLSQSDETGWIAGIQISVPLGRTTLRGSVSDGRSGIGADGTLGSDWAWTANSYQVDDDLEHYGSIRKDFARARGELYADHRNGSTGYRGRALGSVVATSDGVTLARPVGSGVLLVETGIAGVPVRSSGRTHTPAIGSKTIVTNAPVYANTLVQPDFDQLAGGYTADQDRQQVRIPQGISEIDFRVRSPGFFARVTHRGQPIERGVQIQADGQPVITTSAGAYVQPPAGAAQVWLEVGGCAATVPVPATPLESIDVEVCRNG